MSAPTGRRLAARAGALAAGALAAGAAGAAIGLTPLAAPAVAAGGTPVPFTDPAAHGSLGLCDPAGHQVTHGSLAAAPFVGRAVASVPAPTGYRGAGRTATLYVYQPRPQTPAGDWSGQQLTASTRYSDIGHPTAAGTAADTSLGSFAADFHPEWDGLLQLRLIVSAPGRPAETVSYPATVIRVTGTSWRVVGAAPAVDCRSGRAVSLESQLLPHRELQAHGRSGGATGSGKAGNGRRSGTARGNGRGDGRAPAATAPAALAGTAVTARSAGAASGTGHGALMAGIVAAVLLAGAGGLLSLRHRRSSLVASVAPGGSGAPETPASPRPLVTAARSGDDQKGLRP